MMRHALLLLGSWLALSGWAPAAELPPDSLYQVRVMLVAQSGAHEGLDRYRGHPTLVSMFYGSCPASCPMLITSLQVYEKQLTPTAQARLRVLLVSFDPVRDTPPRLSALAHEHGADLSRWAFTSASDTDARKIAALLGVQYRPLPDGSFDHSLLITLLDRDGRPLASTSKLIGDTQFRAKLQAATASEP
jgi:protein SCO1/2